MITEKDLQEAIAKCQDHPNPNANTCLKLAAFYTIKDHISGEAEAPRSYAAQPTSARYDSGSEFCGAIRRKNTDEILPVMDELMETLSIVNPRLYESVLSKLSC